VDSWWILLIFLVIVLTSWWIFSRRTGGSKVVREAYLETPPAEGIVEPDNLTKIKGIGPKVQGLLNDAGIKAFAQLSAKTGEELDSILEASGPIYTAMDKTSWPRQAALAAEGKWEELETLQDELDGGR